MCSTRMSSITFGITLYSLGDQLGIVSAMSVGVDSIDLVELRNRGIKLGHTPGVLTDAVVSTTFHLSSPEP